MAGTSGAMVFIRRTSSLPSICGMIRSLNTRSTFPAANISRASAAVWALNTRYPRVSSINLRTESACSLSSTQRMVLRGRINFPSTPLLGVVLLQDAQPVCDSRRDLPLPQTGPGLWKTKRPRPRYGVGCVEASPIRESRCRCHPGAQGPLRKEQSAERAWLPAPLVWTWVRAYRQLHTGNAGLRPATTSFPLACFVSPWVVLDAAFFQEKLRPLPFIGLHVQEQLGLRTRRSALCSNSSCQ
jgi:hypothetical protein